jgi:hypothetical protein
MDRWSPQLEGWYRSIKAKTGQYDENQYGKIVMFIDGTCVMISRPSGGTNAFYDLQRLFWSGYKKYHNINFFVIVAPNGLVIDVCGPVPGRHSDKWVQSWSSTERRLRRLFRGLPYTVYGDGIYSDSDVIRRRKRGLHLNGRDRHEIRKLNSSRTCVENNFAETQNVFPYISFKRNKKILSSKCGVGNVYKLALLLKNFRSCLRGSQTGQGFFGISPPSLNDYITGRFSSTRVPNFIRM